MAKTGAEAHSSGARITRPLKGRSSTVRLTTVLPAAVLLATALIATVLLATVLSRQ
jgi:hypothetical protein